MSPARDKSMHSVSMQNSHGYELPQPSCRPQRFGASWKHSASLDCRSAVDVFSFRDSVVEDYGQFSRSFTTIKADDIREFVDGRYGDEEYWPSPLIQLNPSFVGGGSIGKLVEQGLLHPECRQIFRWGKEHGEGQELQLHLHQLEALKIVTVQGPASSVSAFHL